MREHTAEVNIPGRSFHSRRGRYTQYSNYTVKRGSGLHVRERVYPIVYTIPAHVLALTYSRGRSLIACVYAYSKASFFLYNIRPSAKVHADISLNRKTSRYPQNSAVDIHINWGHGKAEANPATPTHSADRPENFSASNATLE